MATTTAVIETRLAEQFRRFVETEKDAGLRQLREQAFAYFASVGFPTPRQEDWKYTNVAPLAREDWQAAAAGSPAANDISLVERFNYRRNGFTALNLAFGDFQIVRIAAETTVAEPIVIGCRAEAGVMTAPHTIVIAERGSKATLVEVYDAPRGSFTNAAVQIVVGENASLTHYRVQRDSAESFNIGTTEVSVAGGARYDSTNINLGAALSRHDIDVRLEGEGCEAFVDGLYMIGGSQHSDTHSIIDHQVPNCNSHQSYRGVLNDSSRGVFNGKVFVRANAHGTDARQSNKNLLLSNDARVDTKPQLEIFNDDVKCSHGATVGQLDEEELFYLRTRGLPDLLARNLLTYGFAEEIINKIGVENIKGELDAAVLNRLNAAI